ANSVMRGRLDARRTLKSLVADLRIKKQLYTNNMSCKQKKDCSSKRNSLFSKPSIKKAIVPGFYSIPL
ncbi:hypothetical protein GAC40_23185, partial [Bacteroides thetaiotaomicron]